MEIILSLFLFFCGLFFGSFLLVLADRLPRNENVLYGHSYCESCKKSLKWYELLPVLSFLMQRGQCGNCGVKLTWWYPVTEIVTASLFFVLPFLFPQSTLLFLLFILAIVSTLIVIFIADWKYGIIPFPMVALGSVFSLFYYGFSQPELLLSHVVTGIISSLFFFLIFFFTGGKGMGFGDVVYAFLMGLFLGFPGVIIGLYVAFLTGAAVSLILILLKKKKLRGDTIAFGPFLVLGTLLAFVFERFFLDLFSRIFF